MDLRKKVWAVLYCFVLSGHPIWSDEPEQLYQELEQLQIQLFQLQDSFEQTQKIHEEARNHFSEKEEGWENHHQELKSLLHEYEKRIDTLTKLLAGSQEALNYADIQEKQLTTTSRENSKELALLHEEREQLIKQLSSLQDSWEKSHKEHSQDTSLYNNQIRLHEMELLNLQERLEQLNLDIEWAQHHHLDKEKRWGEIQAEMESLLKAQEQRNLTLTHLLVASQEAITHSEHANQNYEQIISSLSQNHDQAKNQLQETQDNHNKRTSELEKRLQELTQGLNEELVVSQKLRTDLQTSYDLLEKERKLMKEEMQSIAQAKESAVTQYQILLDCVEDLKKEKSTLETNVDTLAKAELKSKEALKELKKSYKQEIADHGACREALFSMIEALEQELIVLRSEKEDSEK